MMARKSKSTSKAKVINRRSAPKTAAARAPKRTARAVGERAASGGPLEFVRTEPSVTVYEVVEAEIYRESDPEVDDQDEFGT